MTKTVSMIIPTLNEATYPPGQLDALRSFVSPVGLHVKHWLRRLIFQSLQHQEEP